jgi:hypothetical protein
VITAATSNPDAASVAPLGDTLVAALRRLAQRHASARQYER